MKTKLVGILVCTLFIATALPAVSSIDENSIVYPVYEFTVENECGCTFNEGYGLGHIPLPDWIESTSLPEPTGTLLASLDWRSHTYNSVTGNWMTSVKNQGTCGGCWAFTGLGTLEAIINIANSNPALDYDLSEQYMISCVPAQGSCPNDCNGGHAMYCYKYMQTDVPPGPNWGALPETCFPYITANGNCNNKCGNWISQLITSITGYLYSVSPSVAQIKAQLANGPVCGAMDVYDNFWQPWLYTGVWDGNGVYTAPAGPWIGPHAIVICGYVDSGSYPSGGYWICKNSWGNTWGPTGMGGYFGMPYNICNIEGEMTWVTFTPSGSNNPPNTPSNPSPANHATGVDVNADLSWTGGDPDTGDTVTYDLYFDTATPPNLANTGLTSASFDPGTMSSSTTYYWQIKSWDNHGASTTGPIWDFTTAGGTNNPPNAPSNPNPANHATGIDVNADLSWTCSDPDTGDTLTYDVYFGTTTSPSLVSIGQSGTSYDPGTMNPGTKYYWKIDPWDNHGLTTPGSLWDFTTASGSNNPPTTPSTPNGPTTGVPGVPYRYTTSATDSDTGDQIKYGWDFDGDGIVDPGHWTGFYASGATCNVDITFGGAGTYYLSVVAEDNHGAQSAFSPALTVVITAGTNNPPTVSITSPSPGATVSGTIPIQGTAADSDGTVTDVQVKVDSGGTWWTASGTTSWSTNFDTNIVSDGSHTIYAQSKDDKGAYSTVDSVTVTVNNGGTNNPPNQPSKPTGQTSSCKVNTPYPYSTSATESDPGDKVKYGWEWTGDGVVDKWDDNGGSYYTPGTPISTQITWTTPQTTYSLKVIAEDLQGAQSPWSSPLSVTTPRNRAINTPLLNFLEQYPILYQLLQRFLLL